MFTCPNDHAELSRTQGPFGVSWTCPQCGGRAVGIGVARRALTPDTVTRLWVGARELRGPISRQCPSCGTAMVEVGAGTEGSPPAVDICTHCHFLWFDPTEFEALPQRPAPPPGSEMSEEAREIMATAAAQQIADQYRTAGDGAAAPEEMWKYLPAIFGMPVEYDTSILSRLPWMTWLIAALAVGVSVAGLANLESAIRQYALIPADPWRHGGATLLTSFLMHGSLFHLISNMYFLLVFGDNVEDALGKGAYLALVVAAALIGDVLHIAYDPRQDVPVLGASGGISGVVLYYALKYPRARLGFLLRIVFYFRWVQMPAYGYVAFWVFFQVIGAAQQLAGVTNVSALAHLGGASVGFAAWVLTRRT